MSEQLNLVCMNAANGSVLWSNNLFSAFGASSIAWDNAASPCLDSELVFVNLNSSTNNQNLAAFRMTDGSLAWSSQNEGVTHTTPIVATMISKRRSGLTVFGISATKVVVAPETPLAAEEARAIERASRVIAPRDRVALRASQHAPACEPFSSPVCRSKKR